MNENGPSDEELSDDEIEEAQGGARDPEPPREVGRELAGESGVLREPHSDIE